MQPNTPRPTLSGSVESDAVDTTDTAPGPQCSEIEQPAPLTLDRDDTFPIASAIAALDRAIGLVTEPEHLIELIERRAALESAYEHTIDLAYEAQEAIEAAAQATDPGLEAPAPQAPQSAS